MKDRNGEKLLTRFELAEALAIHRQTVVKWVAGGMPIAVRGGRGRTHLYRESEVLQWLESRDAENAETVVDLTAARTRKELALADVSELKAGEMRGDLLSREEVETAWRAENSAVRAMLLSWSMAIQPVPALTTRQIASWYLRAAVPDARSPKTRTRTAEYRRYRVQTPLASRADMLRWNCECHGAGPPRSSGWARAGTTER